MPLLTGSVETGSPSMGYARVARHPDAVSRRGPRERMMVSVDVPGPYLTLIALLVIGLLGLVLRWSFAADRHRDYGMLREVATVPSQRAAEVVTEQLRARGVRVTTVRSPDGESLRILVFPADERRAIAALLDDTS